GRGLSARGGSIVIGNPNAPTGVALLPAEIARLLEDHPDIPVVIDEAYVDFGGESADPLIADHPNLLVVQTMSKSRALAGLRVRYGLGGRESCARVVAGRQAMTREVIRLGFVVLPSSANFVFARHPARGGTEFAAALREHAVLVRHFNKPRTMPYLRITVGTEDDVRRLIAAATDILGGK